LIAESRGNDYAKKYRYCTLNKRPTIKNQVKKYYEEKPWNNNYNKFSVREQILKEKGFPRFCKQNLLKI
jgi:hypothetical protein